MFVEGVTTEAVDDAFWAKAQLSGEDREVLESVEPYLIEMLRHCASAADIVQVLLAEHPELEQPWKALARIPERLPVQAAPIQETRSSVMAEPQAIMQESSLQPESEPPEATPSDVSSRKTDGNVTEIQSPKFSKRRVVIYNQKTLTCPAHRKMVLSRVADNVVILSRRVLEPKNVRQVYHIPTKFFDKDDPVDVHLNTHCFDCPVNGCVLYSANAPAEIAEEIPAHEFQR